MTPTLKKILIGGAVGLGGALALRAFFAREVGMPSRLPPPRSGDVVIPVTTGRISSLFGPRRPPKSGASSNHPGIDFAAPLGTAVRAYRTGRILAIKSKSDGQSAGNRIQIKHDDGLISEYFHLQDEGFAGGFKVGDRVAAGATIGRVGVTGSSTGPHLHFEIGPAVLSPVDPAPRLFSSANVAILEAQRLKLNHVA